jgi:hypothetical protein
MKELPSGITPAMIAHHLKDILEERRFYQLWDTEVIVESMHAKEVK